jgi:ribosome-interacting GTPase 1
MQAEYEFTTVTCIPGVITTRGVTIQLLDLPGTPPPSVTWPLLMH